MSIVGTLPRRDAHRAVTPSEITDQPMPHMSSRRRRASALVLMLLFASASVLVPATASGSTAPLWSTKRLSGPARTEVRDASGALIAEFTDGARTVNVAGPVRTWTEPGLATVTSTRGSVRLLPTSYDGTFDVQDAAWLALALEDHSPDVLDVAFEYVGGAGEVPVDGVTVSGDASYGPAAGADFNDFLGIPWTYRSSVDPPEAHEYQALDCSGFVRMVLGYRLGMHMSLNPLGASLPRRAADQLAGGPGRIVAGNRGQQITKFDALRAGDLVFFDASSRDGAGIDHVGIYVGRDTFGHHRFISSRQMADGPTIGDVGGPSILDGSGYWASSFRAIRRP